MRFRHSTFGRFSYVFQQIKVLFVISYVILLHLLKVRNRRIRQFSNCNQVLKVFMRFIEEKAELLVFVVFLLLVKIDVGHTFR